ncbi:MAG: HEPN domain-containing protein [Bacteroidales bacterium]|nr:HEPN domain-containing protein [Bacteroidales bacterium]
MKEQVAFWFEGSDDSYETATVLFDKNRLLHCLFFCHLSVEKALKALYVCKTSEIPPRTHNLLHLASRCDLVVTEDMDTFLGVLMKYQLEGRYPDYNPSVPKNEVVKMYLQKTLEVIKWLKEISLSC